MARIALLAGNNSGTNVSVEGFTSGRIPIPMRITTKSGRIFPDAGCATHCRS
jgi:hypothetical protein